LSSSNGIKVAGPFPNSPSQFEKRYSARTNVTTHTLILKEGSEPKIGRKKKRIGPETNHQEATA